MIDYKDANDLEKIKIKRACKNVLAVRGLSWEAFVSEPIMNWWEITFLDESGKGCCRFRFFRPPSADQNWYEQEIDRQIELQLTTV
ncbi:MAG TPA: hypothetical protein VK582_19455 [Pyrinomonadaceae bacterium]|nr:hypothetical protein [Pyrinomonadaceae bacterium]